MNALGDLLLRRAAQLHAERHVVEHGHMRVERIILEHHGDVALFGLQLVHHAAADGDFARRDLLQPRDHAQKRGFPATGRADQNDEFMVGDGDIDAMDHRVRSELLGDAFYINGGHENLPGAVLGRIDAGRKGQYSALRGPRDNIVLICSSRPGVPKWLKSPPIRRGRRARIAAATLRMRTARVHQHFGLTENAWRKVARPERFHSGAYEASRQVE